jgi:lysosomal alpha-mannosidase
MLDGSIELMVHRRLTYDDRLGAHEALNETAFGEGLVVRGRHFLLVEPPATSAVFHRVGSQQLYMHPLITLGLTQQTFTDYSAAYRLTWSALVDTLPLNVHLLTLDQTDAKIFLVRVEHYFELEEDDTFSHPVTFDLQSIFQAIGNITSAVELTLNGNLELAKLQRLTWITTEGESSSTNTGGM